MTGMLFEHKLSKLLDDPATDPDTGIILEADRYNKAGWIPDNAYLAYVKYVGKLNALPHVELRTRELTDPNTGQVFPISSWPTKSTREHSSAKWTDYNASLQKPEAEVTDQCSDPEKFVTDAMRDCVNAGQQKWDIDKATKKCEKQVGMLKQAIQNNCGTEGLLRNLADRL